MLVRTLSSIVFLLVVLPCIYFSHTALFVAFAVFLSVRAIYEMLRCYGLHKNIPLSSGPTKAGELLMSHVRKAYDENILFVYKGKAKILVSELDGASAAVLGASALGWEM